MTHTATTQTALPISALLAPQSTAPNDTLPIPLSLLGPLPPTTPIHLALNHLYLSSLPEFESGHVPPESSRRRNKRDRQRVLIITGRKEEYANSVEEDDEDYMRERGGDYGILDRLGRVDIRYCPTIKHVMLLLSLLSHSDEQERGPQNLDRRPGLVILWNIGSLLMDVNEANENIQTQSRPVGVGEPRLRWKAGVIISDYLKVVAAAKSAVLHLSSLDTGNPPVGLIILEPELTPDSSLPIFPPDGMTDEIPKQSREKRVKLAVGLERILGQGSSGGIVPAHIDEGSAVYTLSLPGSNEGWSVRRRRCPRGTWGSAGTSAGEGRSRVDVDGLPVAEGDPGGWRWEWT